MTISVAGLVGFAAIAAVVGVAIAYAIFMAKVARYDATLTAALETVKTLETDRGYWRSRCEQLLDAQLVRSTGGPVMQEKTLAPNEPSKQLLFGMAVTEIDSRKKGSAAS